MTISRQTPDRDPPEIRVAIDTICHIIAMAREFDVKSASSDPGAPAIDDDDVDAAVLEDRPSDPVLAGLTSAISDLPDGAQIDLVTLMWLGRDGGGIEDWDDTRQAAAEAHNDRTAAYLCGTPLLGDYLEEGLAVVGRDCGDEHETRL